MKRAAVMSLATAIALCTGARAQEPLRPYQVVGDAVPQSLTGVPGDPARGRAIVIKRESRAISGGAISGQSGARSERRRRALVGGRASPADG